MFRRIFGVAVLVLAAQTANAQVYNVANDFSATSNPNTAGIWRYGSATYSAGIPNSASFSLYLDPEPLAITGGTLDLWRQNSSSAVDPNVTHNGTANTLSCCSGADIFWSPNEMSIGPNPGTASIVRFSAPTTATYLIDAFFADNQVGGDGSDVYVLRNGSLLFSGNAGTVVNSGIPYLNAGILLNAGDFLDFAVGPGADNNPTGNNTQLRLSILQTPEPAALAGWLLCGLAALGAVWSNGQRLKSRR